MEESFKFLPRIISFSGRKQSGKTELTKICEKYGYEVINFADPMKNMICHILKITREELEQNKEKQQYIKFKDEDLAFLMSETQISVDVYINNECIEFKSIREILQKLGTDVIRKNNPHWHVLKIQEIIMKPENINKRYCFGDTRFKNEKMLLESLNAECWFVIRPNNFNISNHISEKELTWSHFNRNIIVNQNLEEFKNKWDKYMKMHENQNIYLKNKILNETNLKIIRSKLIYLMNNYDLNEIIKETKLRKTQIIWLCKKLLIYLSEQYNEYIFKNLTLQDAYLFGQFETNGFIEINKYKSYIVFEHENRKIVNNFKKSLNIKRKMMKKNNKFSTKCNNNLIIENLKTWNLNNINIKMNPN